MIIGNTNSIKILQKYISSNTSNNFLLLVGPQHIGKTSIILDIVQKTLGQRTQTDFLYIRDLSELLGKKHIIKVSNEKQNIIQIDEQTQYEDIGTREINKWLQKTPIGNKKILYIENIERMNQSASNAFLKTCEEPFPNRIIIATTNNVSSILDTIISRATIIKFYGLGFEELINFCEDQHILPHNIKLRNLLCHMAMGKPGLLLKYKEILQENKELENDLTNISDILTISHKVFKAHKILLKLKDAGLLNAFIDGRINFCVYSNLNTIAQKRIAVKKRLNSNVNIDNLILCGII